MSVVLSVSVVLMAVNLDLILDGIESPCAPKIRGIDIVNAVRVKSFVRSNIFIELMNEQKDGIKLPRISHEGIERSVGIIFPEAQGVVGAVG